MKALPNIISFSRIILSISLILMKPFNLTFYIIYIICGISDMMDGFIARKTKATSKFGEKLDSAADMIMVFILLIILFPHAKISMEIILWVILITMIRLLSTAVGFGKYKTFCMLHTYGNKITGMILFILPLLFPFIHTNIWFYFCCFVATISAIEELIIQLTSSELQVNRCSIFKK